MEDLLSAEVVTASGDIVRASTDENADLFWGLQGGGGNFGVVSWLEYRLHLVEMVTSGLIAYPFEQARNVLKFFREITSGLPYDLTLFGALLHAPDGMPNLAAIFGMPLRCRPARRRLRCNRLKSSARR